MGINLESKYQVQEIVEKERLIGLMNNTKWNELFNKLHEIDELISYRCTYIDGSKWSDDQASLQYTIELEQIWGNFKALEYIDIDTRVSHFKGKLLKQQITDHKQKVIDICLAKNAKFALTDIGVRIYGYIRHGNEPKFFSNT